MERCVVYRRIEGRPDVRTEADGRAPVWPCEDYRRNREARSHDEPGRRYGPHRRESWGSLGERPAIAGLSLASALPISSRDRERDGADLPPNLTAWVLRRMDVYVAASGLECSQGGRGEVRRAALSVSAGTAEGHRDRTGSADAPNVDVRRGRSAG